MTSLIFGANALNALATNAMVNILFFIVLILFALSFFGLFEPSWPNLKQIMRLTAMIPPSASKAETE